MGVALGKKLKEKKKVLRDRTNDKVFPFVVWS